MIHPSDIQTDGRTR